MTVATSDNGSYDGAFIPGDLLIGAKAIAKHYLGSDDKKAVRIVYGWREAQSGSKHSRRRPDDVPPLFQIGSNICGLKSVGEKWLLQRHEEAARRQPDAS